MAYEVTKRIKGRDYRYRVEGVRDAATGRTRTHWRYLGRVEGDAVIAPARTVARVTRDDVIAAAATLLETRDAARVTVSVIARRAGVSAGTFYRHFPDRRSALGAAVAQLCAAVVRDLPALDGPVGSLEGERRRLHAWFSALHRAVLAHRGLRWFVTSPEADRLALCEEYPVFGEPRRLLAHYLERLQAAGRATLDDADELAGALLRLHYSLVHELVAADHVADAASRWAEVFPAIERAVFPHRRAAA